MAGRKSIVFSAPHRAYLGEADFGDLPISGADIIETDLSKHFLIEADLRKALLRNAFLIGADLSGVDLLGAHLHRANLRGASLIEADLSEASLLHANLRGAALVRVNLHKAHLYNADLSSANLRGANLIAANLRRANLIAANLRGANLRGAYLDGARLSGANLRGELLTGADLSGAFLDSADLSGAHLRGVNLDGADLDGADFSEAELSATTFANVDLSEVNGLEEVHHQGPASIGIDTIYRSKGKIPHSFLRGAGVPENFITYMASLTGQAFEYYSAFISHSSKDEAFAQRLYADLQAKGVRCWYAPHDLRIGAPYVAEIDRAIRVHDKSLLILSESSVQSGGWVEREVTLAETEEVQPHRQSEVIFPVRIDDAVMATDVAWAQRLRKTRHIGDFTTWKSDHDAYQQAFDRLLRDLQQAARED